MQEFNQSIKTTSQRRRIPDLQDFNQMTKTCRSSAEVNREDRRNHAGTLDGIPAEFRRTLLEFCLNSSGIPLGLFPDFARAGEFFRDFARGLRVILGIGPRPRPRPRLTLGLGLSPFFLSRFLSGSGSEPHPF